MNNKDSHYKKVRKIWKKQWNVMKRTNKNLEEQLIRYKNSYRELLNKKNNKNYIMEEIDTKHV